MRKARADGFRSRAAYKLLEINTRDRLFIPGARVVDLGAAPGGWSQVAAQRVAPGGTVIAVDLLEIVPISNVTRGVLMARTNVSVCISPTDAKDAPTPPLEFSIPEPPRFGTVCEREHRFWHAKQE